MIIILIVHDYQKKAELVQEVSKFLSLPYSLAFVDGYLQLSMVDSSNNLKLEESIATALSMISSDNLTPNELYKKMIKEYLDQLK